MSESFANGPGKLYSRANGYKVDVFAVTFQHKVAHIATHDITLPADSVSYRAYLFKDRIVNKK